MAYASPNGGRTYSNLEVVDSPTMGQKFNATEEAKAQQTPMGSQETNDTQVTGTTAAEQSWFHATESEEKMVSATEHGATTLPQVCSPHANMQIPTGYPPDSATSPYGYGAWGPYGTYMAKIDDVYPVQTPIEEPPPPPAGPFGMSRRRFWIIVLAIILAIGALVGGVVGGLTAQKNKDAAGSVDSQGADGGSGDTNATVTNSYLAAVNFTDSSSTQRRALFYQSPDGCLFLSQWHAGNDSWTPYNISEAFVRDQGGSFVWARANTALAAAAIPRGASEDPPFAVSLYYLDENGQVRELVTYDEMLYKWEYGKAWDAALYTCKMSQLTAVAQYCPDKSACKNEMCLAYQDLNQTVNVACAPDWHKPELLLPAYPGTSMSMIPFAADDGNNVTMQSDMRMSYYTDMTVRVHGYTHGNWTLGIATAIRMQPVINQIVPKVVSAPSDSNSNFLVVSKTAENKFTSSFYHHVDGWTDNQRTSFANEDGETTIDSPKEITFGSLAMSHDGRLYALTADQRRVVEYTWSSDAPYDLHWKQNIELPS